MPSTHNFRNELEKPIDEIGRFIHIKRWLEKIHAQYTIPMAENNDDLPLKDFPIPSKDKPHSSIVNPTIQANNFELKSSLLQTVEHNEFSSSWTEDPNLHLSVFIQYTDTLKNNDVDPEAIVFSFSP